jgi:tetratricopeptide (TPR) repeat protein
MEVLADNLFSLSALSIQINADQTENLNYALEHYEIRLKLHDGTPFSKDRLAMAHGEVGQVYMVMGQYEKAIKHSEIAIKITEKSPRFLVRDDWPTRSHCYVAFALCGLNRIDEAIDSLSTTLHYLTDRCRILEERRKNRHENGQCAETGIFE